MSRRPAFWRWAILGMAMGPAVAIVAEPIHVGQYRQLFIDEYAIDKMDGLQRTIQQPDKHKDNPIIKGVHEWERGVWGPAVPSALFDEGKIRLWYRAVYFTRPFSFVDASNDPEIRQRQIADLLDSMVCQMAYAESEDGVNFVKPKLGIIDYKGSKENNLVWGRYGDWANMVMKLPDEPNPNKRYRAIIWAKKEYGGYYGNIAIYSPDGLHWTLGPKPATGALDHAYNFWWDQFRQEWVSLIQFKTLPRRTVGRMVSKDFTNWYDRREVLAPDEKDPLGSEFYIPTILMIDQLYLCFLHMFHTRAAESNEEAPRQHGARDVQLATSRDGIHWERSCDRQVFLPIGSEGAFDQTMVMFVGPPVRFKDKLMLYYSATKGSHGSTNRTRAIGLATLRPEGFVAVEPKETEGTLTTHPFRIAGENLIVNANASGGAVTVEVLNGDGTACRGFGPTDAKPLTSDSIAHTVAWNDYTNVSSLMDKVVRLKFQIKSAKLYSFRLQ